MVYVDEVTVTPNPADAGKTFVIKVKVHEEYEGAKRYPYKNPYRYGEKESVK